MGVAQHISARFQLLPTLPNKLEDYLQALQLNKVLSRQNLVNS